MPADAVTALHPRSGTTVRAKGPSPSIGGGAASLLLLALVLTFAPALASAQTFLTQDEALKLAFPGATAIERRTAFLGEKEVQAAKSLAGSGVEVRSGMVTYYVARRGSAPLGTAYFDAHRVRTLPEVLMVVVSPQATVERVEILKFAEPPQYRAPEGWLKQFRGKPLSRELSLRGGVVNMTGATLTSKAVTDAARRTLALHQVINPAGGSRAGR